MTVTILQADTLDWSREQPDDSIDLVFCSPPYEAARTYGIGFKLRGQEYVDWAVERFMEHYRICRGLVCWVIEGQTRSFRWSAAPALFMADLHRRGIRLRKPPIYKRVGIPGSGGPDFLRNDYEFVVCASKGRLPWSDNTAMGHPPKWGPGGMPTHRLPDGTRVNDPWLKRGRGNGIGGFDGRNERKVGTNKKRTFAEKVSQGAKIHTKPEADGSMRIQAYMPPPLVNPGNIVNCTVGGGQLGSPLAHENEAPFPEKLAEFFVLSFCPPGGTVYDAFCGSGTTGAVAKRHGRSFIGTDVRESQVELTRRRLAEVQMRLA
jgi:hypothetical protein